MPAESEPSAHSWLGGTGLRTELPSGVLDMGARSYVPQLGAFLQPDPQPGGSANAYAYTQGDPLNESDPSGEWTFTGTSGGLSAVGGEGEGTHLENGVGIAAGAIIPAPPDIQAQEALANNLAADQNTAGTEEVAEFEPVGGDAPAGGGARGFGRLINLVYPGLPAGARCEGNIDSKKYDKENKKLCHEIESKPWEPVKAACWLVANVPCNIYEKWKESQEH